MLERRALRDTPTGLEWINPAVRAHAYIALPAPMRVALHDSVLNELESRRREGDKITGLELAWHAMRAGRVQEGSRYLLRGAQEAVLCGAARDAELALMSGMSGVEASLRGDATLCLAEILLELSRPNEALDLLNGLGGSEESQSTMATVLRVRALMELSRTAPDSEEGEQGSEILCKVATTCPDPSVRAKAVSVISGMQNGAEATDSSLRLVEIGNRIPLSDLQPADAVGLLASLARHHYRSRNLQPCEELLVQAIRVADSAGLRNSDYMNALTGLGAVACAQGRYVDGLDLSLQLYAVSKSIGNARFEGHGAGNAALCMLRLGRYDEAMEWADRLDDAAGSEPYSLVPN